MEILYKLSVFLSIVLTVSIAQVSHAPDDISRLKDISTNFIEKNFGQIKIFDAKCTEITVDSNQQAHIPINKDVQLFVARASDLNESAVHITYTWNFLNSTAGPFTEPKWNSTFNMSMVFLITCTIEVHDLGNTKSVGQRKIAVKVEDDHASHDVNSTDDETTIPSTGIDCSSFTTIGGIGTESTEKPTMTKTAHEKVEDVAPKSEDKKPDEGEDNGSMIGIFVVIGAVLIILTIGGVYYIRSKHRYSSISQR